MAMTANGMAAAIKAQMEAIPGINVTDPTQLQGFCTALGTAIVAYIAANAQATIPPASIVTTGSAATQSGPAAPVLLTIA